MKLVNLLFIALLAIAIGACDGAATEQKKDDAKDASNTEKKDDAKTEDNKPAEPTGKVADSPKAAVENFVEGVKAKDEPAIRGALSEGTIKVFDMMAKEEKVSFYEILTKEDEEAMKKMPKIRNEKIDGDKATAELTEPDKDNWSKVNFVKENGSWKLSLFSKEEADEMIKKMGDLNNLEKKASEMGTEKKADSETEKK